MLLEVFAGPLGWELQNMLTVASLMAQAAVWRKESRGAHFRDDYPQTDDEQFKIHSCQVRPVEVPA